MTHTEKVLHELEAISSKVADAETGQRGYILTGKESYLEPYYAALEEVKQELKTLRKLTADNSNQQQRLNTLEPLIARKLNFIQKTITLRQNQGLEVASEAIRSNKGKKLMDNIRKVTHEMQTEENELLKQRSHLADASARSTLFTHLIGTFLNCFIFAGICHLIYR